MLAKKFRLPVNAFPVRAKTLYRGQYLVLKTAPNHLYHNRIGMIITRKTASSAVDRNRLRRKVFDLFQETTRLRSAEARKSEGELRVASARQGMDLLVVVKPIKLDPGEEEKLLEELNSIIPNLTSGSELNSSKSI